MGKTSLTNTVWEFKKTSRVEPNSKKAATKTMKSKKTQNRSILVKQLERGMLMKRRQMKLSVDLSPPRFKVENYSWKKEIYSKSFFSQSGKVRKIFPPRVYFLLRCCFFRVLTKCLLRCFLHKKHFQVSFKNDLWPEL